MAKPLYKPGDIVVLKGGAFRSKESGAECQVVSVLPEVDGAIHYRVHLDSENCERRITEADIQGATSRASDIPGDPVSPPPGGSWIRPMTIRSKR